MMNFRKGAIAIALALVSTPVMAASFVTDSIDNPSGQWAGIDYWGVQVGAFSTFDQLLSFKITTDSKVDLYIQGSPKFQFSDLLLNGKSILSNFTVNSNSGPVYKATGYAAAGDVLLQFKGDYTCRDCNGDWFGGYVQVAKSALPGGAAAVPAAVPEPTTWATMILGLGMIGALMRRRRRAVASFA